MTIMTSRERFLALLNFQPVDRLPIVEWAPWWDVTIGRWKSEGLPEKLDWDGIQRHFELDEMQCIGAAVHSHGCPSPAHHGAGIITNAASYEAVRSYLFPDTGMDAMVKTLRALKPRHESGEVIIRFWLDGFFWLPRSLFGIENHLFAFYDEPELMHRINQELLEFHLRAIDRFCEVLIPDMAGIAEDMSYNHGAMLSYECYQEFLLPYYQQVVPALQARGVKVFVDSDGNVEPLIPWLLEANVQGIFPLERQGGVDVARLRAQYPDFLMMGGYNKLVMSRGEEAMRSEFERLLPVMQSGGYIPSVDHQTPPDVSLENYRIYRRLFEEYVHRGAR